MHSPKLGFHSKIASLALALLLVTVWLLMHGYQGLTGDGRIYALQALARLRPELGTDLYLQNVSQDQFTIFSPLYAGFINMFGLEQAAQLLTMVFTIWFWAAAWSLAWVLLGRNAAWLATAFLLIIAGDYGGSGVFRLSEPFLTARLPAEALIVTAMVLHVRGKRVIGLLLAIGAFLVHPLIALPGLLLLICLRVPIRVSLIGAGGGLLVTLAIAVIASNLRLAFPLSIMDAPWLEIVRERSQYLFLQLWSTQDWELNARPFIYLAFTAAVIPEQRMLKLCAAAALVGASGLAVALVAGLIGPVAIFVQGQAWRWVWISVFVSALLLPATAQQVWRDKRCGPLCATLLVSAWTLSEVDGSSCASLAMFLWLMRAYISPRVAILLRWLFVMSVIAIIACISVECWTILSPTTPPSAANPLGTVQIRDIFRLRVSAVVFTAAIYWGVKTARTARIHMILCALLVTLSIWILPVAFKQSRILLSASDINKFADWLKAIPPTSTVLVTSAHDVGAFVWFTMGRPNYLTVDQSAGVVFSRATALEVRRRSEVLLPLMDPSWRILTSLRARSASERKVDATLRPLTSKSLIQVCSDFELGFVIAPKDVGFAPLRHEQAGAWKDWNLYDCRKVRSSTPEI